MSLELALCSIVKLACITTRSQTHLFVVGQLISLSSGFVQPLSESQALRFHSVLLCSRPLQGVHVCTGGFQRSFRQSCTMVQVFQLRQCSGRSPAALAAAAQLKSTASLLPDKAQMLLSSQKHVMLVQDGRSCKWLPVNS